MSHEHLVRNLAALGLQSRGTDQDQACKSRCVHARELGGDEATEAKADQAHLFEREPVQEVAHLDGQIARVTRPIRLGRLPEAGEIRNVDREALCELIVERYPAGIPRGVMQDHKRIPGTPSE